MDRFGEKHRNVIDLDNRIRTVDQEAQAKRLEKMAQYRHMQMERVRLDMLASVDQVNQIDQEYREAEGAQTDMDRKRAILDNLMEEKKRAEERLDNARKKLNDLNYVINRPTAVRISPLPGRHETPGTRQPQLEDQHARRRIPLAAAGGRSGTAPGIHEHLHPYAAGHRPLRHHARARHRAGTR